jgi:hypothetical protein
VGQLPTEKCYVQYVEVDYENKVMSFCSIYFSMRALDIWIDIFCYSFGKISES